MTGRIEKFVNFDSLRLGTVGFLEIAFVCFIVKYDKVGCFCNFLDLLLEMCVFFNDLRRVTTSEAIGARSFFQYTAGIWAVFSRYRNNVHHRTAVRSS